MKLLVPPTPKTNEIEIQPLDGLEFFRSLPFIGKHIKENEQIPLRFAGKCEFNEVTIILENDEWLKLGQKVDLVTEDYELFGVIPLRHIKENSQLLVVCCIDYYKFKGSRTQVDHHSAFHVHVSLQSPHSVSTHSS